MNASAQAGRELDALIAERVMGWAEVRDETWRRWETPLTRVRGTPWLTGLRGVVSGLSGIKPGADSPIPVPRYSTDIAAAWQVFTAHRLLEAGWLPTIEGADTRRGLEWEVGFAHNDLDAALEWVRTTAEIPAAICRAALRAQEPGGQP
jgi:hypothetical protein